MRTLDRSREHTTIYGDSAARFYQDGRYFNAEGNEVDADAAAQRNPGGPVMPVAAVLEPPAPTPPPVGDPPPDPNAGAAPPVLTNVVEPPPLVAAANVEESNFGLGAGIDRPDATTEATFGTDANGSPTEG